MPRLPTSTVVALAAGFALVVPRAAAAQIRASEAATVSQTVDGTTIAIEYSRPMAKGRTLFGPRPAVVHWGEIWTPGANWATTLEASRDIRIGDQPIAKGRYSVWLVPRDTGSWTFFLDRQPRRFHTRRPRPDSAAMRLEVRPEQGPHAEALTWEFPAVTSTGTTLQFRWGTTVIPLAVRVEPSRPPAVAAAERAAYVGKYSWNIVARRDTVARTITITETADGIAGRITPTIFQGYDPEVDLIPLGERRFRLGLRKGGRFFDAEEIVMQFTVVNGRATGFEIPTPEGAVGIRGERLP